MVRTTGSRSIPRAVLSFVGRLLRSLAHRAYSLALIVLIVSLSWLALRYLVRSLLVRAEAPPQITEVPLRLTEVVFGKSRGEWQGLSATPLARSPLSHYHRLDAWIQSDLRNNCTTSGCHAPLPHSERKEVRAFLNMHATSLHCGVCHMESEERPLHAGWYELREGTIADPPAVLLAIRLVGDALDQKGEPPAICRAKLIELLEKAGEESGSSPELQFLREHFLVVRPESDEFRQLLESASRILPRHCRGEYGRKIAVIDSTTEKPIFGHPDSEDAVKEYLSRRDTLSSEEREQLLRAVHPLRRTLPLHCHDCHAQDGLLPFRQLGYPPTRVETLTGGPIFQLIERISSGQPFHLPQVLDQGNAP